MQSRQQSKGRQILKSLSLVVILSYFEVKEVMKLQIMDRYVYNIAIPRAMNQSPVIFKQAFAIQQSMILFYNTEAGKIETHSLKRKVSTLFP